jgi:glycosyltransferase involved in cell wall biosynthesis
VKGRRTRVTFLVACHNVGGFETKLDTLLRNLDRDRFDASVLLVYPHYKARRTPEDVRNRQRAFFSWPDVETVELFMKRRLDALQVFRAAAVLRRLRPDAVLFFAAGPAPFIAPAASRLAGVPRLIRAQDTVLDGLYPRPLRPLDRLLLRRTDLIVTPSIFLKRVVARGLNVRDDRIDVIPNGIDLGRFGRSAPGAADRSAVGIPPRAKVVGMIANLVPVKDHAVLLAAVPRVLRRSPGAHFLLIGDGPLRARLEAAARYYGVDRSVHFLGYRNDVRRLVPLFDVSVLCSKVEVHPISLIESMACGVPVVAPDVGGIPEIVRNGETGILVPRGDPEALAGALVSLLNNPSLARTMGEKGRRSARLLFSMDRMIRSFESTLRTEEAGG